MRCLNCGKGFRQMSVNQLYCSVRCGEQYRRKNKGKISYPSIMFSCANCGRTVVTEEGSSDKRTRFCCAGCEKKYWRHPPADNPATRINFRSVREYASWERRTNRG